MLHVTCTSLYLNGIIFEPAITVQKPESIEELSPIHEIHEIYLNFMNTAH